MPRIVLTPDFDHASRGPKGNGETRRWSSVLTARRAAPSDEYAQAGSRRRVFLAVSCVTDLGGHRVKKGSTDVATGTVKWFNSTKGYYEEMENRGKISAENLRVG